MSLPVTDRLEALKGSTAADLAWLLGRVPAVTEVLRGERELLGFRTFDAPGLDREASRGRLAALLASPGAIDLTLASLNRFELQLVKLACWYGGTLERRQALAEAGPQMAGVLDQSAENLARLLLSDTRRDWLRLRPGITDVIHAPGYRARDWLEYETTDVVATKIRYIGGRVPARKADRVDELEARLRDPRSIKAVVAAMPKEIRRVFELLAEHGPMRVRDLGIPYYWPGHGSGYSYGTQQSTPLHWLDQRGLVGVDTQDQVAWVWSDVMVALTGRLFADWSPGPTGPEHQPVQDAGGFPLVLGHLTSLLEAWAAEPAPALQSGGLGVRPVRAAAKALGLPAGAVGLLVHLAIVLRLLDHVLLGTKGTGRNQVDTWGWAPTDLLAAWKAERPARQWALLVQAWQDSVILDESYELPERFEGVHAGTIPGLARMTFLRLLAEFPPERGLPLDDLLAWAGFAHPALLPPQRARGLVDVARALGLVPAAGPVGLTRLGRELLDSPEAVEAALPAPRTEFTVQADHTVITPPDLALEVITRLERYADLESAAGARIYRLSERRIAAALDDGDTATTILEFLECGSTVPIAQNVAHLVRDIQRRHGQLRVGHARSYLRADDPSQLTSALGVKAAKLSLLAPTVAVSPLEASKLVSALRTRGLMPVLEQPDGAVIERQAQVATTSAQTLPPLRQQLVLPDGAALEALAKTILDNP